jgi:hypothetical protein
MSRDLLEVGHQPYVAAYGRVKGRILALIQDNNNKHGI